MPNELTTETIKQPHRSYPQNPIIADALYMTAFLESWGTGVSRMVDACKAVGLPEPEYGTDGGFVWITFKRPNSVIKQVEATSITKNEPTNEPINEPTNEPTNELLSVRQKDIIAAIRLKPSITREELADITKIS